MALGFEEFVKSIVSQIIGKNAPAVGIRYDLPGSLGPIPIPVLPPLYIPAFQQPTSSGSGGVGRLGRWGGPAADVPTAPPVSPRTPSELGRWGGPAADVPTAPPVSPRTPSELGRWGGPAQEPMASIEPWLSMPGSNPSRWTGPLRTSVLTPAAQALAVLSAAIPSLAPFLQAAAPVTWSLTQSIPGLGGLTQLTPDQMALVLQLLTQPTPSPVAGSRPTPTTPSPVAESQPTPREWGVGARD